MITNSQCSHIVELIYASALEPSQWPGALDALQNAVGCSNASLAVQEVPSGRLLADATVNVAEPWLTRMRGYDDAIVAVWGGIDVILNHPMDRAVALSRINPDAWTLRTNPYLAEWALPQGIDDCMAIVVARDTTTLGSIGMGWSGSGEPITDSALTIATLFVPHLQRAGAIARLLEFNTLRIAELIEVIDSLSVPLILLTEGLEIVASNSQAHALLRDGGIARSMGARFALRETMAARQLEHLIAACRSGDVMAFAPGPGIPLVGADGNVNVLHVLPLRPKSAKPSRAVAAIFFASKGKSLAPVGQIVRAVYGLTDGEVRVFDAVAQGLTVSEGAARLNISTSTFRSHLVRIFDKTDMHRQSDIVRLAAALASPAHAPW